MAVAIVSVADAWNRSYPTPNFDVYTNLYINTDGLEEHRHQRGCLRAAESAQTRQRKFQRDARSHPPGVGSDWRTNAGFLTDEAAADLEAEVEGGLEEFDDAVDELADGIDDGLSGES